MRRRGGNLGSDRLQPLSDWADNSGGVRREADKHVGRPLLLLLLRLPPVLQSSLLPSSPAFSHLPSLSAAGASLIRKGKGGGGRVGGSLSLGCFHASHEKMKRQGRKRRRRLRGSLYGPAEEVRPGQTDSRYGRNGARYISNSSSKSSSSFAQKSISSAVSLFFACIFIRKSRELSGCIGIEGGGR